MTLGLVVPGAVVVVHGCRVLLHYMLCHPDTVLHVHPLFFLLRLRLLLVCKVLARLMLLLMVHHLQLQMLRLRTMLLTSLLNNLLRLLLFHLVTLLPHLMTLLLHHMAVLMRCCYLSLLRSPHWHKVTIFMVLLCKLLLLPGNLWTQPISNQESTAGHQK